MILYDITTVDSLYLGIRLNSACNMAYFEYEGDVISVDISIDTLKQCVPDNLYPCLMCERKFGSAEEFIRHDHMGMSAGQFNKINRELKNGEVSNIQSVTI